MLPKLKINESHWNLISFQQAKRTDNGRRCHFCDDSTIARLDRSPISYLKELVAILEYFPEGNKGLIPMAHFAGIYNKNKKRFTYQLKR